MFARHITMIPKGNSAAELTATVEREILPLLRQQKGFLEEITFVSPDGLEAVAISLWETREDAEAYSGAEYAKVLTALSNVVEGTPRVRTFEVTSSTFGNVAARTAA